MHRLARSSPFSARVALDQGWAFAAGEFVAGPGAGSVGDAADALCWLPLSGPEPVAAALAEAGQWSLDGPPRDFDATTWWYRCHFDLPDGEGPWRLGFDGLATLAEVFLNGEPLLASRNMFRAHEIEVGPGLRRKGNELLLRFDPLQQALAERRPRPQWRAPMVAHQQLRWFRTTLLGRTPGWSPPAALVGPWRPVWLEPADATRLTRLNLQAELIGDTGLLQVQARLAGETQGGLRIRVRRVGADGAALQGTAVHEAAMAADTDHQWSARIELPQVARWWPHTHGEPALYQVSLCASGEGGDGVERPLGRVGFRRVHVDQSDDSFRLVVNDVPVFARGACWTPLDAVRLRSPAAHYDAALAQVRAAGMNLLRVGGTMVYEDDAFLDACDAQGVMLWQDLMFANMDYPGADPGFLAEVDEEVAQQMAKLQARPCVAVVCGNSEVAQQAAMWGAPRAQWTPALFHEHLPQKVAAQLPGVPYWPSSAHGGAFPFQPGAGTSSYYGVGAYRRDTEDARSSGLRFATECLGFANVPTDTTLARLRELNDGLTVRTHSPLWKARASRDLGAGYDFDDVRDHYVERLFGERAEALRRHDPARHLMLGRAATAEAIDAAFQQWRAVGSACGGALVWFLRDLWAGAGWGLLDDHGLPKSGFHALARACQPLHLGITDEGMNGLHLHLVNEGVEPVQARLALSLYRDGETPVAQAALPLTLAPRSTRRLPLAGAVGDGFMDWNWAYRFGPPPADVLVARCTGVDGAGAAGEDGPLLAERIHFIAAGDGAVLARREIGLQAHSLSLPDGRRQVTLSSRAVARAVHFEAEGWQASDEFFHLAPGAQRVIEMTPAPGQRRTPAWRAAVHAINALVPVTVKEVSP